MDTRTVLFHGESLLLSLLADSLQQEADLRILRTYTPAQVADLFTSGVPDVLIYDLLPASESAILPLLFQNPHLLLVGLDVETNRAVVLARQERSCLTLEGIREMVERG